MNGQLHVRRVRDGSVVHVRGDLERAWRVFKAKFNKSGMRTALKFHESAFTKSQRRKEKDRLARKRANKNRKRR